MVNSLLRAQIGVELCHCQGCRAVRRVAYAGSNDVRGVRGWVEGEGGWRRTCRSDARCDTSISRVGPSARVAPTCQKEVHRAYVFDV